MAARSDSDVRNELGNLTECSICMNTFTDPRALPCVHVFCGGCLQGMIDTAAASGYRHINCPLCQRHTPIPQTPDDFPKAFFFHNLCEIMQATKSTGSQKCHPCADDNDEVNADWICIDCADVMCNHCKKYHIRANKSHLCIESNNITPDKLNHILQKKATTTCQNHNKELEYFCTDCNQLICVACKITDKTHEQHDIDYTKDQQFVQVHRNNLEEFTAYCENKLQLYKKCIHYTKHTEKKKDKEIDDCVQKIEDRFQEMYEVMKLHKDELIEQAEKVREQFHTGARIKHETLSREHDGLEVVVKDTIAVVENGTDIDVVRFSTQTLSNLETKVDITPDGHIPNPVLELKFEKSCLDVKVLFGDLTVDMKFSGKQLGSFTLNYVCTGLDVTQDDEIITAKYDTNEIQVLSTDGGVLGRFDASSPIQNVWDVVSYKGNTYASDSQSGNVYVYDGERKYVKTIETKMKDRCGMAIHDDTLYITSCLDNCAYRIPLADSKKASVFLKHNSIKLPWYIAAVPEIAVVTNLKEKGSNNIVAFNANGEHLFTHGGPVGKGNNELDVPYGVVIYRNQYIIVSDSDNKRLVVLSVGGLLCGYIPLEAESIALALSSNSKLYVSTQKPFKILILQLSFKKQ